MSDANVNDKIASIHDQTLSTLRALGLPPLPHHFLGWEDHSGFYIQGALKNVNNAIYRYISPPSTYADDYPIEGRTFWIRAGWKF